MFVNDSSRFVRSPARTSPFVPLLIHLAVNTTHQRDVLRRSVSLLCHSDAISKHPWSVLTTFACHIHSPYVIG